MANPTLSGEFVQVYVTVPGGTVTDISTYLTEVVPQRASADTDLTTFASGGGPVTETHVRGAAIAAFTLKGLYDPVYAKIIRQLVAARSGFTLQIKSGSNATPTSGDELFIGTMTCLNLNLAYNPGANAGLDVDVVPADGGAIVPQFGNL